MLGVTGGSDYSAHVRRAVGPRRNRGISWPASEQSGKWDVVFSYFGAQQQQVATWEYDPATGRAKYLAPNAKRLSWLASD